jgi:hypothetical protein
MWTNVNQRRCLEVLCFLQVLWRSEYHRRTWTEVGNESNSTGAQYVTLQMKIGWRKFKTCRRFGSAKRVQPSAPFFPIFSCCSKSGEHPEEDLVKSGYKTNREAEYLGTLLPEIKYKKHPSIFLAIKWKPIMWIWRF